jgi:transcriptional regulator with XRE-family HTH domain
MSTDLGTWLRTQREERGWSRSETARRLITAARETGDGSMPDAETIRGYIYRWEHGKIHTLSERYVLYYCRAFGIKPAQFGPQPAPAPDTEVVQPTAVLTGRGGGAVLPTCRLPWDGSTQYRAVHGQARGTDGGTRGQRPCRSR